MVDTILTSQTPNHDQTDGSSTRSVGQRWQTSSTNKVVSSGRIWVPGAGLGTTALYQIWDTTGPTKLAEVDVLGLTLTNGAWNTVPLASPIALTQSHNYIVCLFMDGSNDYVWLTSQTYPIGSGGTVTSDTSIFRNNGTSSQAPNDTTFTGGLFFTDVNVTDNNITVNVGKAVETDTALPIGVYFSVPVGTAREVDAALPVDPTFHVSVGTAVEVDAALPVGPQFSVPVGTAHEVDTALPIAAKFSVSVGTAHEVDRALPFPPVRHGAEGPGRTDAYMANQLAGVLDDNQQATLTMSAALTAWAGEDPDISMVEALNRQAGRTLPNYLALAGILNELAGTTDLEPAGALDEMV